MIKKEVLIVELKNGECQIEFEKGDKTIRSMKATLNYEYLKYILGSNFNEEKRKFKYSDDVIRIFDVEIKEWRSFRIDKLTSFINNKGLQIIDNDI